MTSDNSSSVSSSHAVDAFMTALMNLNMSSVTANALIIVIQAIADGDQNLPSAPVHPGQKDCIADLKVEDNADDGTKATPVPSSTTPAPVVSSMAAGIVKPSLSTNADSVGLSPSLVLYQGFPYEIPYLSDKGPFYYIIKSKHVGVLFTWEDTSPQVTGVSGAIHSHCPSVEVGVAHIHAAIECKNFPTFHISSTLLPWVGKNCTSQKKNAKKLPRSTKMCIMRSTFVFFLVILHPKYLHTTLWNSKSNNRKDSDLTRLSDPDIKFRKLVNGSTHRFMDDLALQYMGSTHSEDSWQPILDALNIAQEAEEAIIRSGGDVGLITIEKYQFRMLYESRTIMVEKMVASEWTSKEQKEWLTTQLPDVES
ncbi:uncharacterized protein EDB93DRAFT_1103733 [Suillus bovinus]|uniref:uncharacterized protein n=1 Tax=Suillus bovinus TaxID=48563 RepID=UPI001B862E81|nr:uncharacterized protein EDB93DRAFT_1103733 [Suillus bovinus]KAG2148678.1 hypothetical protein EDB93DRAFT_1103733 [Suillus bovinus]